jgi:spoIIIJ-associated protein
MEPSSLQAFVKEFLQKLGVDAEVVEVSSGHRTIVAVTTQNLEALMGPGGEHLRAINMLAKRMIEKAHGEDAAAFLIDINGHHEAQMERVRQDARVFAQRVRLFKHDVEMPPLSSYERLVVHELFANDPDIRTESAGEGKFRHIVLKYNAGEAPKNP